MNRKGFKISSPAVINFIDNSYQEKLINTLGNDGVKCIVLDGTGIFDKEGFLERISERFFPGKSINGWEQFRDMFSEYIGDLDSGKTAFIWSHVDQMLEGGLEDLLVCADILTSITRSFYDDGIIHLNFFLGEGPNFPEPEEL